MIKISIWKDTIFIIFTHKHDIVKNKHTVQPWYTKNNNYNLQYWIQNPHDGASVAGGRQRNRLYYIGIVNNI